MAHHRPQRSSSAICIPAESLLREARRQKNLPLLSVPSVCLLAPDGDIARRIKATGAGHAHQGWACYHTEQLTFTLDGVGEVGIIGCAVGAPFAVLVAGSFLLPAASYWSASHPPVTLLIAGQRPTSC